jgi:hypothetical protein
MLAVEILHAMSCHPEQICQSRSDRGISPTSFATCLFAQRDQPACERSFSPSRTGISFRMTAYGVIEGIFLSVGGNSPTARIKRSL